MKNVKDVKKKKTNTQENAICFCSIFISCPPELKPIKCFLEETPPLKVKLVLTNPDRVGGAVPDMHKQQDFKIKKKEETVLRHSSAFLKALSTSQM